MDTNERFSISWRAWVAPWVACLCLVGPIARAQTINEAAQQGNLVRVRRLLMGDRRLANFIGPDGNQPLHFAAHWGRLDVARMLIAAGANVNGIGSRQDHWTPLFNAADQVKPDIARLLLANGAKVDVKDNLGNTPLARAAGTSHTDVAELLIGAGANVNDHREPLDGWTPLFTACGHDAFDVMRLLIRHGADMEARSNDFASDQVGPEWTTFPQPGTQQGALRVSVTPKGAHRFLGDFGSQTVRLALSNLPPHREISLYFDLYILRTWDGNNFNSGPDVWSLSLPDGPTLLHTTFANAGGVIGAEVRLQAYPGVYPGDHHGCGFGAVESNTLGYTAEEEGKQIPMDAVYRPSYTLAHTSSSLLVDFSAVGLEVLDNESWGLANVQVSVAEPAVSSVRPTLARSVHLSSPSRSIARSTPRSVSVHHSARPATTRATKKKPTGTGAPTKRLHAKEKPPGI